MPQTTLQTQRTRHKTARPLLYLWFPYLAAEERLRSKSRRKPHKVTDPFVLTKLSKGTERIVALSTTAEKQGLKIGQTLADARSLAKNLTSEPADIQKTEGFLVTLAKFSERFSPLVGISGPKLKPDAGISPHDALVLDIGGIAHLFGGERAMLQQVVEAFSAFGLTVKSSIADSKGTARALCLFGSDHSIVPAGQNFEALKDLSLQALEPSPAAQKLFHHLGLSKLKHIVNIHRGGLARRFGMDMVERIDQILGRAPDPIEPINIERPFSISLRFPEPLSLVDDLVSAAERVITPLWHRLEAQGKGMMRLCLTFTTPNGSFQTCDLSFAVPNQDLASIMRLVEPKLDLLVSDFGFDHIRVQALSVEDLNFNQASLSTDNGRSNDQLNQLHNLLGNRLGFERVCQFRPTQTHLPEQRYELATVLKVGDAETKFTPPIPKRRPLSCFRPEPLNPAAEVSNSLTCRYPPQKFSWRRRPHHIKRAFGPERITPPWWQHADGWEKGVRDYWQIETENGDCLWLFTQPQNTQNQEWFVSGSFH